MGTESGLESRHSEVRCRPKVVLPRFPPCPFPLKQISQALFFDMNAGVAKKLLSLPATISQMFTVIAGNNLLESDCKSYVSIFHKMK